MSDLRKAAEQAATDLEELIHWHGVRDSNDKLMPAHNQTPEIKSAIETLETLRQALAQPEQEPVCAHGVGKTKCDFCKQPEQEPVAGMFEEKLPDQNPPPWVRDYKPKREWQGLTDEEFKYFKFYAPQEIVQK